MDKKKYLAPSLEELALSADHPILETSATPWYKQGGSGNFSYTIEEDDEWA